MDMSGNCMDIGSDGVCVTCNGGHVLNGYRCVPDNIKLYACYIWNQKEECQVCKSGYNIYEGHCLLPG